jgi:hypothetical protein
MLISLTVFKSEISNIMQALLLVCPLMLLPLPEKDLIYYRAKWSEKKPHKGVNLE